MSLQKNRYYLGFSTTDSWVSRAIRWVTRSKVSHAFFVFPSHYNMLVFEANSNGVGLNNWVRFERKNKILAMFAFDDNVPAAAMLRKTLGHVGRDYDYMAIVGFLWVMAGRWFGKKWKNPLADNKMEVCSELVQIGLNAYSESDKDLDPEVTTPEDALQLALSKAYLTEVVLDASSSQLKG